MKWMFLSACILLILTCCIDTNLDDTSSGNNSNFYFGADLSYVNQILDHNGTYKVEGVIKNPYQIFKDKGTNLVRLRLWHNPSWTKDVYPNGTQLYNDLLDVEKSIQKSKAQGMKVLLDFHYSDNWADPGKQEIPLAWREIKSLGVLKDSIYNYTFKTLTYLSGKGLMPELVQLGNETNCGMLYTNSPGGFPALNVCNGQWTQAGEVFNSAIKAVRDASASTTIKPKIILHVADPKNLDWWFTNLTSTGKVTDFDIIGFSYYPIWHTTIGLGQLTATVHSVKTKFTKDILLLETAYPWTTTGNDNYTNIFGSQTAVLGYPYSIQGQKDIMITMTKAMKAAGGLGIVYWEPAWITSNMKDQWGTGSSWENCTFFDYQSNTHAGFDFMKFDYSN